MSVKLWQPPENTPTPDVVMKHGWRDEPYIGPKRCEGCWGSGTLTVTVGKAETVMHRTCPDCGGRGHT